MTKDIVIMGGGTTFQIRPHLALAAPAYGNTARSLYRICEEDYGVHNSRITLCLTKMAGQHPYLRVNLGETNQSVKETVDAFLKERKDPFVLFFNVALCDFDVQLFDEYHREALPSGNKFSRLDSKSNYVLELYQAEKVIQEIRRTRKDVFLVGFKTTTGSTEEEQFQAGLRLLKKSSCNLVLANDLWTRTNQIICPEVASYCVTKDRETVLSELVGMALARSENTFSPTTVVGSEDDLLDFEAEEVPSVLRYVVTHCVTQGAYKPFHNVTVGHFGFRHESGLWSSRRKQNYLHAEGRRLVSVRFPESGPVAHGAKPSAGVRSQYQVLSANPQWDCVVHFHCPKKEWSLVPVRSQREFECGSHQCGANTVKGLVAVNEHMGVVYLDKHGPNIVFSRNADPAMVCRFIDENFYLDRQTR